MIIDNQPLFEHHLKSGINLFLGAGFSVEASSKSGKLPVGDNLKDELLDHFKRKKPSSLDLPQLCQILSSSSKKELKDFFINRFTVTEFDELYKSLESIKIKSIFTTNIDDLIFKIFKDSSKYYINDIQLRGPAISNGEAIDYIGLHGCVAYPGSEFAFSPLEISSSFERDKDRWFTYVGKIQTSPTLYWGYRVQDAGVLQALSNTSNKGRQRADAWIVLREDDEEAREYYSSLGFQIIIGETKELLKYISKIKIDNKSSPQNNTIESKFEEYKIPTLSSVPVRSLSEFFLGAEPIWYDIFTNKIHKTTHLQRTKNESFKPKHVLIIGAPLTGKSTLLKQLSVEAKELGSVLYINEITPEKAQLLSREIKSSNEKVYEFIDNAVDSSEAIQTLVKLPNIKIIAAERDFIYDTVSYRFTSQQFNILDVSGLNDFDIQSIIDSIPQGINKQNDSFSHSEGDMDIEPSFLEVMTHIIKDNALADRFVEALKAFKKTAAPEHDLLLLACYLYSCRIPISVDIAAAYLRDYNYDALKAFNMLSNMDTFLYPYEGQLSEDNQAYFVPRSRTVSEIVMKKTYHKDMAKMLETFHQEVSPARISRYDIFKRYAYDAKLMGRAFPDWERGLSFYEDAFTRDRTHSLKQQGALYLAHKKKYELAFIWIDEAKSITGNNNPTIRNTYAVILFNANYDKPNSPEVLSTLEESMEILQRCYNDDYRKIYHARIFAEQSIKFKSKYPDVSRKRGYLELSMKWLESELKNRPNDRWMNNLKRSIQRNLR
ncbi:SIR2 family protein [Escherichia coli]